jgi:hypothetical protein
MKKSKILAIVLFFAFFTSSLLVVNIQHPTSATIDVPEEVSAVPNAWVPVPMGTKGIWMYDMTGITITLDGALGDWATVPHDVFNGVDTYIGYDATNVYVAVTWADATNSILLPTWNKTGLVDASHVAYDLIDGADDMVTVGFSDGVDTDLWTWTASNKTTQAYAYEHDGTTADGGTVSFIENLNGNETLPAFDNTNTPIVDYFAIANGTIYNYFYPETPTGGQTDVDISVDYTAGVYTIEMVRALDTGDADDFVMDFADLTGMSFFVGKANGYAGYDMNIPVAEYILSEGNDAATVTFDTVTNPVTESLLITGTIHDDYEGYDFIVEMSGWEDTYGPGSYDDIAVNEVTGNWSYLFLYNIDDMPLGEHTVNVTLTPKYETAINLGQAIEIDDIVAPQILGLVDMHERYPFGVPNDTLSLDFTVGLSDNYYSNADLTAYLYIYKDEGIALQHVMTQFSPGSTTFSVEVDLDYDPNAANNYTYFVQVWDGNLNKATSVSYWFIYGETTPATPGFTLIIAILGLAGASVVLVKKYKK